jgi:regulator of sigma E protease
VTSVIDGGPGERAGLRSGDRVLSAGGQPITTWQEFVHIVQGNPGRAVAIQVQRDGQVVPLEVTPAERALNGFAYGRIEVARPRAAYGGLPRQDVGPVAAMAHGFRETGQTAGLIVDAVAGMFTGRHSPRSVGGPILIGEISGQVARLGLESFLSFMALISINLAILNLLPIPVLDGGHLVFLAVEGVRGRPISMEQRIRMTQFGMVLIIALMVWAFGNDIARLFGI